MKNIRVSLPGIRQRQQGVVLVIALIMLMLVTLVTVSSMTVNVQQEKMAGNVRDRDLAFQAGESAVLYCLNKVKSDAAWITANKKTPTVAPTATHWDAAATWTTSGGATGSTTVPMGGGTTRLASAPLCIVEDISGGSYRVTGRGVGGSGDAIVMLQATYTP